MAVTLCGDGLIGAVAGALRDVPGAVIGVLPGGRGNDFARVAGIPLRRGGGVRRARRRRRARRSTSATAGGRTFLGIASLGFDSDANRIANEAPARLGPLVYLYGALRALARGSPPTFTRRRRRRAADASRAGASPRRTPRPTVAGCSSRPTPSSTTGRSTSSTCERTSKAHFLRACCRRSSRARTSTSRRVHVLRGAEVRVAADRPFTVYADGDPIGELPITIRAVPGALRVLLPDA